MTKAELKRYEQGMLELGFRKEVMFKTAVFVAPPIRVKLDKLPKPSWWTLIKAFVWGGEYG